MNQKTRIALADDHPIFLAGLRNLIDSETDFELVGHAESGNLAAKLIQEQLPDVAVIDISMPELNGIALARFLTKTCPSVRILVLTLHEERSFVMQALAAGVRGYLLKRSASEKLARAIRAVNMGELYVDPSLTIEMQQVLTKGFGTTQQPLDAPTLTDREESVLKFSAQGWTIKEIASRLKLSVKTVETYKARASDKLRLRTRAEIVRFGAAHGWLDEA